MLPERVRKQFRACCLMRRFLCQRRLKRAQPASLFVYIVVLSGLNVTAAVILILLIFQLLKPRMFFASSLSKPRVIQVGEKMRLRGRPARERALVMVLQKGC